MMMNFKERLVSVLRVPSFLLERRLHCGLHVFNYHQVASSRDERIHLEGTFTQLDFYRKQLQYLKSLFEFVSLSDGLRLLADPQSRKLKRHLAALSFDDGDASLKESVPVALELGIPVTLFVNSDYLGDANKSWVNALTYQSWCEKNHHKFLPAILAEEAKGLRRTNDNAFYERVRMEVESRFQEVKDLPPQYLTRDELWAMDDSRISVGLHCAEHQRVSMMSNDWIARDLDKNIQALNSHPRYTPIWAAPFGSPGDISDFAVGNCLTKGIKVALHSNGYNRSLSSVIYRIPSDRKEFSLPLLASASIPV